MFRCANGGEAETGGLARVLHFGFIEEVAARPLSCSFKRRHTNNDATGLIPAAVAFCFRIRTGFPIEILPSYER